MVRISFQLKNFNPNDSFNNYYSRQYRDWCPHNAIRISAPRHINSWVAILMIHGIFFKFIVHREKTWRGSF